MSEHGACQSAWDLAERRRAFAEARLAALTASVYRLAANMDAVGGHTTHVRLGGKTLGGAVRALVNAPASSSATEPESAGQERLVSEWLQYARDAAELGHDAPMMTWASAAQRVRAALGVTAPTESEAES